MDWIRMDWIGMWNDPLGQCVSTGRGLEGGMRGEEEGRKRGGRG